MTKNLKPGDKVFYDGKKNVIEEILEDGSVKIQNPDWDSDAEAEDVEMDEDYDVPFWIYVSKDKLTKTSSEVFDPNNIVPIADKFDEDGDEIYIPSENFVEFKKDSLFHIGQSYENEVAETLFCKNCGGNQFNVGQGGYYTAIRCVKCKWEKCIHQG